MSSRTKIENELATDQEAAFRKKYTLYKITVTFNKYTYFVQRRYKEFRILYNQLKKSYPDKHLDMPPKRLLNNLDPNFIKVRGEGLSKLIDSILNDTQLQKDSDVARFLDLEKHKLEKIPEEEVSDTEDEMNIGSSEDTKASPSDFDFLKVIGKGSFGKVYLAKNKTSGCLFAVKVLFKSQVRPSHRAKAMMERHVLVKNVAHPFLCHLHYAFQTPRKLYFVLQYVNGGELFFHLQRQRTFPEERARFYAAEIASALGYLHKQSVIYRDLKPENILLDSQGHIVLTDFGLCKHLDAKTETHTFCGTPEYLAPEVIQKKPYTSVVDWWCLGSVLYEMLFGIPPFYSRDQTQMYHNVIHKGLRLRSTCSAEAAFILYGLLDKNPEKRLGSKNDFDEIREQGFFADFDWVALEEKRVDPPFVPKLISETDTSYIDKQFTEQLVSPSVFEDNNDDFHISANVQLADNAYFGFSYVAPMLDDD